MDNVLRYLAPHQQRETQKDGNMSMDCLVLIDQLRYT